MHIAKVCNYNGRHHGSNLLCDIVRCFLITVCVHIGVHGTVDNRGVNPRFIQQVADNDVVLYDFATKSTVSPQNLRLDHYTIYKDTITQGLVSSTSGMASLCFDDIEHKYITMGDDYDMWYGLKGCSTSRGSTKGFFGIECDFPKSQRVTFLKFDTQGRVIAGRVFTCNDFESFTSDSSIVFPNNMVDNIRQNSVNFTDYKLSRDGVSSIYTQIKDGLLQLDVTACNSENIGDVEYDHVEYDKSTGDVGLIGIPIHLILYADSHVTCSVIASHDNNTILF